MASPRGGSPVNDGFNGRRREAAGRRREAEEKEKKRSGRRDGARPGPLMHSLFLSRFLALSLRLDGDRGGRFSGTGHETARYTAPEERAALSLCQTGSIFPSGPPLSLSLSRRETHYPTCRMQIGNFLRRDCAVCRLAAHRVSLFNISIK